VIPTRDSSRLIPTRDSSGGLGRARGALAGRLLVRAGTPGRRGRAHHVAIPGARPSFAACILGGEAQIGWVEVLRTCVMREIERYGHSPRRNRGSALKIVVDLKDADHGWSRGGAGGKPRTRRSVVRQPGL
jgi:hypothetical protein